MKKLNLKSLFTVLTVLFSFTLVKAQEEWPCTVIYVDGGGYTDKVWAFSVPGTTAGWDNGYEGHKFLSTTTPAPQIFVMGPEGNYQISSNETIHNTLFGFIPGVGTEFTLTFEHYNLAPTYQELYLIDHLADSTINVFEEGSSYSFTASADDITERFSILSFIDKPADENAGEVEESETDRSDNDKKKDKKDKKNTKAKNNFDKSQKAKTVKVFSSEKNIVFNNKNKQNCTVKIINAKTAKVVKETIIPGNSITSLETNTGKGAYIVSVTTVKGIENTTVMIK